MACEHGRYVLYVLAHISHVRDGGGEVVGRDQSGLVIVENGKSFNGAYYTSAHALRGVRCRRYFTLSFLLVRKNGHELLELVHFLDIIRL